MWFTPVTIFWSLNITYLSLFSLSTPSLFKSNKLNLSVLKQIMALKWCIEIHKITKNLAHQSSMNVVLLLRSLKYSENNFKFRVTIRWKKWKIIIPKNRFKEFIQSIDVYWRSIYYWILFGSLIIVIQNSNDGVIAYSSKTLINIDEIFYLYMCWTDFLKSYVLD